MIVPESAAPSYTHKQEPNKAVAPSVLPDRSMPNWITSEYATTILNRLLHHSTTINIRGESYRLKDRRKAGLVPPRGQEGATTRAQSSR
jgi:IstB-like ATP binding protein